MSHLQQFKVYSLIFNDVASIIKQIVPTLSRFEHKGMMGKIGVIGGSRDYCGAPFYASAASLKFGADLSYIFCSKEGSGPIKAYSPEAMVTPFYNDFDFIDQPYDEEKANESTQQIIKFFPRLWAQFK